jgi:thiol-disulfide isomerase/thioredoxin
MKYFILTISIIGTALLTTISCSSSKKTQTEARTDFATIPQTIVPDTFVLPVIPEGLTNPDDRAQYLAMHFWDRFNFADRELIQRPDITEQAFVDYISILQYVSREDAGKSLLYTLDKAETDTAFYRHFASLFDKYLYDPNSPFRNEEFYLPVLQQLVQSPLLPEETVSRYAFQLDMALKNRIGQKANDFLYTLASGQSFSLYDLRSEYTLLMFSNPGCPTCEAVMAQLNDSKPLNDALALNSPTRTMLTVLTLYPDNDLSEWLAHLPQMPAGWVHAYDKGMEITQRRLYDIKAIPTLYLLDKEKKVLLKDTSLEAIESFFSVIH